MICIFILLFVLNYIKATNVEILVNFNNVTVNNGYHRKTFLESDLPLFNMTNLPALLSNNTFNVLNVEFVNNDQNVLLETEFKYLHYYTENVVHEEIDSVKQCFYVPFCKIDSFTKKEGYSINSHIPYKIEGVYFYYHIKSPYYEYITHGVWGRNIDNFTNVQIAETHINIDQREKFILQNKYIKYYTVVKLYFEYKLEGNVLVKLKNLYEYNGHYGYNHIIDIKKFNNLINTNIVFLKTISLVDKKDNFIIINCKNLPQNYCIN